MSFNMKRIAGITLLEVILVLTIFASITLLGMRQYIIYRNDADLRQVKYNVGVLMQGLSQFYRANCAEGKPLDPLVNNTDTYQINIADLMTNGYLPNIGNNQFAPNNPLIDANGGGTNGYFAQLNRQLMPRTICIAYSGSTCTNSVQIGQIVLWRAQVAIALTYDNLANQYKTLLGASCVSTLKGGTEVVDCAHAPAFESLCRTLRGMGPTGNTQADQQGCPPTGGSYDNYLVWEQLPAFFDTSGQSTLWASQWRLNGFLQNYTTLPTTYLTGSSSAGNNQYYRCVQ